MGKTALTIPIDVAHEVVFILDYLSTPGEPSETLTRRASEIISTLRGLIFVNDNDGWIDISTAPTDESVIIGCHPLWVYPLTIYWCTSDGCWKRSQDEAAVEKQPTHWQPMPGKVGG